MINFEIREKIREAIRLAEIENIRANAIVINKNFIKTPLLRSVICGVGYILPPMICGLEMYFTDNELPENYAFAITEACQTERDRLVEETEFKTAKKIWEDCIDEIMRGCGDDKEFWVMKILIETFKKYGVGFEVE